MLSKLNFKVLSKRDQKNVFGGYPPSQGDGTRCTQEDYDNWLAGKPQFLTVDDTFTDCKDHGFFYTLEGCVGSCFNDQM